jgi:RimJ/RimL family protein N-acetyltransferase
VWSDLSPRLQGQIMTLEPLAESHGPGLFDAAQPAEIWRWWPFNPAVDKETFDSWLHDVLEEVAAGRQARFAILDRAGRPIGTTSYCELRPEHRNLEIGWTWLAPGAWGSGVNTEAKLLLLRHAFDRLGCQRVEFYTDALNDRSRTALAALPAQCEGVLRDIKILPSGRRRSSAVYSILDHEWPDAERQLTRRVAAHLDRAADPSRSS